MVSVISDLLKVPDNKVDLVYRGDIDFALRHFVFKNTLPRVGLIATIWLSINDDLNPSGGPVIMWGGRFR